MAEYPRLRDEVALNPPESAFPTQGDFEVIHNIVHAMQYDGTLANAYEILAWVYRTDGVGRLMSGNNHPDILVVGPLNNHVFGGNWVVSRDDHSFVIMPDIDFRVKYQPVKKGPVMR